MSVQLFIYPQYYNSSFNPYAINPQEYIVDGQMFNTILFAVPTQNSSSTPDAQAIIDSPPTIPNQWYKFETNGGGYGTGFYPVQGGSAPNYLEFLSGGAAGIYQELSNLQVGSSYKFSFEVDSTIAGSYQASVRFYDTSGTGAGSFNWVSLSAGTTYDTNFTCTDVSQRIAFYYATTSGNTMKVINMQLRQNAVIPSGLVGEGQVIVDLYNDQNIPLTLSVDNFLNVAEKTQSYSKSFKLPGTKRNNKVFKNVYDITASLNGAGSTYDFNPYRKTEIILQQDGYTLFKGFLRLISIDTKAGELSYNVNLFSETITLADILKTRTFSDLDFDELTHDYKKDNIKGSWDVGAGTGQTGVALNQSIPTTSFAYDPALVAPTYHTSVIKYPFVDWTGGTQICAGGSCTAGFPEFTSLDQFARPWLSLKYLINKIFFAAEFTYTSTFFSSTYFDQLIMDFNWGENSTPIDGTPEHALSHWCFHPSSGYPNPMPSVYASNTWENIYVFDLVVSGYSSLTLPDYDTSTSTYTASNPVEMNGWIGIKMYNYQAYSVDIAMRYVRNGGTIPADIFDQTIMTVAPGGNPGAGIMQTPVQLQAGDTWECQWRILDPTTPPNSVKFSEDSATNGSTVEFKQEVQQLPITSGVLLNNLRGKLNQWDFIKGILTMFNLVTTADPTNPQNIIIDRYDVIFPDIGSGGLDLASRGIKLDWTSKIDVTQINLKPLTTLKKTTTFQYDEDSNDYVFNQYKNSFRGFLYGSLVFDASDFTLLVGENSVNAKPFAATCTKPFSNLTVPLYGPAIYKLNDDGTGSSFDNKPRIQFWNGKVTLNSGSYFIPTMNGGSSENATVFGQCTGFDTFPALATSFDINFGACQIIGADNPTSNNLFNIFWSQYYFALYNADCRVLKIKVNLSPSDINQFSFSDIVMIQNRAFRVNKIDYKPNSLANVEFILIP